MAGCSWAVAGGESSTGASGPSWRSGGAGHPPVGPSNRRHTATVCITTSHQGSLPATHDRNVTPWMLSNHGGDTSSHNHTTHGHGHRATSATTSSTSTANNNSSSQGTTHHHRPHHGPFSDIITGPHTTTIVHTAADNDINYNATDCKLVGLDSNAVVATQSRSRSASPGVSGTRNVAGGQAGLLEVSTAGDSLLLPQTHDCFKSGCQRIVINVSGQRYETQLRTLNRYPNTLLGNPTKRRRYWDARRNEIFIDRHRPTFQAILYYYQSGGRLRRPFEVPEDVFIEELEFYQLDESIIREFKQKEGFVVDRKEMPAAEWQREIWLLCEEPDSSRCARAFASVSVSCIMVSIVNFCTETIPAFAERPACINVTINVQQQEVFRQEANYGDPFFVVESVCVAWFTVEFLLRLVSCPSKRGFCRDVMNIFDVLAIVPYFITLVTMQTASVCDVNGKKRGGGSFLFTRVLRVFRIFKLSKHSHGLRILGLTIKTSMRELGMFFFFLAVAMVIFSSAVYYAEAGLEKTQLTSIPGAFWWAIVTMTTVGYGDVTPIGVWGKLVGTLCVIAGVLTIALPVPVVVANFNNFYRHGSASSSNGL